MAISTHPAVKAMNSELAVDLVIIEKETNRNGVIFQLYHP